MAESWRTSLLALALGGCAPPTDDAAIVMKEQRDAATESKPTHDAWPAVIAPAHAIEIAPSVDGVLESVLVRAGDRVVAGDILATLDAARVREELSIAQAEVRARRATLAAARVDDEQHHANLEQLRALATEGHASALSLEDAEFDARRATAAVDAAAALVAESDARITRLRRNLDDTAIVAPFSGIVAERHLDGGAITGPTKPILRLIAGDVTWLRFAVDPVAASKLGPGTRVRVRFEPEQLRAWARVRHVAPEIDSASELLFVEAELEPGTASLPIGTAAFVDGGSQTTMSRP